MKPPQACTQTYNNGRVQAILAFTLDTHIHTHKRHTQTRSCVHNALTCTYAQDNRTVFVRGIAFGIEQQPFEEAFSDVGPVKQCFLVRDKGAARHKGCGYVQYAVPEDAQRVVQELNGKLLGGRKLLVSVEKCVCFFHVLCMLCY